MEGSSPFGPIGSQLDTIPFNKPTIGGITLAPFRVPMIGEEAINIPPQEPSEERLGLLPQTGGGIADFVINNLGREFHITDMGDDGVVRKAEFCGPGTKLAEWIARGDKGINELDRNCKLHDLWYRDHRTASERHPSDIKLAQAALRIAEDPSKPEMQRKKAKMVAAVMSGKTFLGLGKRTKTNKGRQYGGEDSPFIKLASKAVDKLVDFVDSRRKKKKSTPVIPQHYLDTILRGPQSSESTNVVTKPTPTRPQVVVDKSGPSADKDTLWDGTSIRLYKKNGTKKTRKELEDELYLGIAPSEGAGRRGSASSRKKRTKKRK